LAVGVGHRTRLLPYRVDAAVERNVTVDDRTNEVEPLFVARDAKRHDVRSPEVEPTVEQRRALTQVFGIASVRHGWDASGPTQLPPPSLRCDWGVQKAGEDLQSRLNHPLHHQDREPHHARSLP
jgi:hypothetical protein